MMTKMKAAAYGLAVLPGLSMIYDLVTGQMGMIPLQSLVYWTGVWATALLILTFALSPIAQILRWPRLIDGRRILGVAGLIYSLIHLICYVMLRKWEWAAIAGDVLRRPSLIIASLSLLGLLALGLTSHDLMVKKLGAAHWHRLHRLNGLLTLLALVHFLLSPGSFSAQFLFAGCLFWTYGWRVVKSWNGQARLIPMLILASLAGLFTGAFEILWQNLHKSIPAQEVWSDLFDFTEGPSSIWIVWALGLVIAAISVRLGSKSQSIESPSHDT